MKKITDIDLVEDVIIAFFLRGYIRIANEPFHRVESAVGSKGLFVHVGRRSQL